jgi:hypothetical protein
MEARSSELVAVLGWLLPVVWWLKPKTESGLWFERWWGLMEL